jgi:hypothetical protein
MTVSCAGRRGGLPLLVCLLFIIPAIPVGATDGPGKGEDSLNPDSRAISHQGSIRLSDFVFMQRVNLAIRPDGGVELARGPVKLDARDVSISSGTGNQTLVSLAVDPVGNYVTAYADNRSGNWDIYSQRLDNLGDANGSEIAVFTGPGDQFLPSVSANSRGGFAVVWENRTGASRDAWARRFGAAGNAEGAPFPVSASPFNEEDPEVAVNSTDGFRVVWSDNRSGTGYSAYDIYARRFLQNGSPAGGDELVSNATDGQVFPVLAFDSLGVNAVVAWEDLRSGNPAIYARWFDRDGAPVGGEIQVSRMGGSSYFPAIAVDGQDNFTVAWERGFGIHAQKFDPRGVRLGPEMTVAGGGVTREYPAIAANSRGDFIITWQEFSSSGWDIFAQVFDPNGNAAGPRLAVCTARGNQTRPDIAVDSDDDFLIVWTDSWTPNTSIKGRRYSPFPTFVPSGTLTAQPLSAPADLWAWSSIQVETAFPNGSGNSLLFDFTTDGGYGWQQVPVNGSLSLAGNQAPLQMRARFFSADERTSPVLYGINVTYIVNRCPSVEAGTDRTAWRREVVVLQANASDPDGDPLQYSWTQLGGKPLSLNGTHAPSLSLAVNDTGIYRFRVEVTDGYNWSAAYVDLSVLNRPPAVDAMRDIAAWKGDNFTLSANGTDPDADILSFNWTQLSGPVNYLAYAPGREVVIRPEAAGLYVFQVVATDGESISAPATFNLTIWSRPPVAILTASRTTITAGDTVMLDASGSRDPDGNIIGYRFFFGNGEESGWVDGQTYEVTYTVPGSFNATVTARDSDLNESNSDPVTITVLPPNRAPAFVSAPPQNATTGKQMGYQLSATDEDGDLQNFSLVLGPEGMTIENSTDRLSWMPAPNQTGSHIVRLSVSDGRGGEAEQRFTITVVPWRPACNITGPVNGTVISGKLIIAGISERGAAPIVLVEVRLDGGGWKPATGNSSWKLDLSASALPDGRHSVEARAFDGYEHSAVASVTFSVHNTKEPPVTIEGGPWWAFAIAVAVALAFVFIILRRKGPGAG